MKKFALIVPALALLLASGCTKRIELDLNNEEFQRVVVDGWFTNQTKAHEVKLTLTSDYFKNEAPEAATGAQVSITDGVNTFPLTEAEPGIYRTAPTVAGEIGKTYTLEINYNGETYTGSHLLDTVPAIDSIYADIYVDEFTFEEDTMYRSLFLFTQELPGLGDHYMWRVYQNGEPKADTLRNVQFVQDDLVDGNYIWDWNFYDLEAEAGDQVYVEQLSISEEIFDGFLAVMLETDWRGGIFDSPPANVPTNMTGGALGFFVTSGVSTYEFEIQE